MNITPNMKCYLLLLASFIGCAALLACSLYYIEVML